LLGTGIQKIELENTPEREQIYLTAGLGLKIGIANRMTLTLEGRNTAYRYNAGANLLTAQDKIDLNEVNNPFQMEDLTNWSAAASLQFYIGGRKPGQMSDLDRAYFDSFTRGSGGLNVGLGPYIGLHGFYWRGLEDDSFTKFDKLAMYGGEMRLRLNTGGGMVPFVMLGGGKLDVQNGYAGKKVVATDSLGISLSGADDRGFAMGGAGLLIPLTKNFKVFGSARAVLTAGSPVDDLTAPEEIHTSWFYSAGIKLNFGRRNKNPNDIVQDKINEQLLAQQEANDAKVEELKLQYDQKVLELENALIQAYAEQDLEKAAILKEEKQQVEQVVEELENIDEPVVEESPIVVNPTIENTTAPTPPVTNPVVTPTTPTLGNQTVTMTSTGSEIRMSPAEFENLIEEILEGADAAPITTYTQPALYSNGEISSYQPMPSAPRDEELLKRIENLENLLSQVNQPDSTTTVQVQVENEGRTETETKLLALMYQVDQKLNSNNQKVNELIERLEAVEGKNQEPESVEPVQLFDGKKKKRRWWKRKNKE
jgi:hypothetical protein